MVGHVVLLPNASPHCTLRLVTDVDLLLAHTIASVFDGLEAAGLDDEQLERALREALQAGDAVEVDVLRDEARRR